MSSDIWVKTGIYDPTKRFAFKNITNEPFTFTWAKNPITVQADETIELPHHLAVLATTQLVDQIMIKDIRDEEERMKVETKNPMYRSNRGLHLGIPAMRAPLENKILRELKPNESKVTESQLGVIRAEVRETLINDLKAQPSTKIDKMAVEGKVFEDINLPHQG